MYAIAIHIDSVGMEAALDDTSVGFDQIAALLESEGFEDQGGSVFFGTGTVGAVEAVLAARRLGEELHWLRSCLSEIRLLRVDEATSLKAAFEAGAA